MKKNLTKTKVKLLSSSLVISATLLLSACSSIGTTGTSPQGVEPSTESTSTVQVAESPSPYSLDTFREDSLAGLIRSASSKEISVSPQEEVTVEEQAPVEATESQAVAEETVTAPSSIVEEPLTAPVSVPSEGPVEITEQPVGQAPIAPQAPPAVAPVPLYPASTVTLGAVTVPISYAPLLTEAQAGNGVSNERLSAPATGAGIFAGNNNSVRDNTGLFLVGHNPGSFAPLMGLSIGSRVVLTDANGQSRTFEVREFYRLNVHGVSLEDGVTDYYSHVTDVSGEKLILQACEDIAATRLRVLIAFPID